MARGLAKARDYDYSNVGKQGRRTGITLKEGRRDEHGMEELDGMFSSPEKSFDDDEGDNDDDDDDDDDEMMGSEGMSMDEGNGPRPTDFLARSPFFPPIARSPRKSGLGGSPRRTPGLRSSPMVQHEPASSSPTSGRQRTISGRQPLNDRRPNTAPIASANTNGVRPKSRGFDSNTGEFANDENLPVDDDEAVDVFEDMVHDDDFGDDNSIDNSVDNSIPDNASEEPEDEPQDEPEEEASPAQAASQRNNKRPATDADIPSPESHPESDPKTNPKRKRGGRPKGQSTEEKEVARPAKKAKTQPLDPELAKVVETHVNRTGPLKGRSLYILKREEAPNAAAHTRSGRVSVRPLAYWRNERCVYGDGEADVGQRYPLSTIKEIIRTEELLPEKGPKAKKRKTGKTGKKSKHDDSSDDEADERDDWEKDDGVLHGYVKSWDSEQQVSADGEEVLEIAYAPSGVETREVKDSTFKVAKLFSQSFMGSGLVELPPNGVKRPKNAKRMHMIFCVCQGRVQVDINGVQFTAGKGCMFQVPRGNHYSFANTYHKDARLFFTQAFEPMDGELAKATAGADDNEHEAEDDNEAENEHEEAAKPKGKAKAKGKATTTAKGRGRKAKAKE